METTDHGWVVIDRDACVLTNAYVFDDKTSTANTFVARLKGGKLLVVSPIFKASEGMFAELDAFGEVGAVVANNGFHHLGQPQWKARYPNARFFTPTAAMPRIAKKNPAAGAFEPLAELQELLGPDVGVGEAAASKCGESWAWAKIAGGYAWFASDLLANIETLPSNFIFRLMFKWTGSAPGYKPFNLAMKFTLKDKAAVLKQFVDDVKAHPPTLVIPGHGALVTHASVAKQTEQLLAAAIA